MGKFAEVIEKSLEASADAYKAQQAIIEQQETEIHKLDGELFEARSDAKVYRFELDKLLKLILNPSWMQSHIPAEAFMTEVIHAGRELNRMMEERDKE